MRRLDRIIEVSVDASGAPRAVRLETQAHWRRVQRVVDQWVEAGRWWDGEVSRQFYRLEIDGLIDISHGPDGWRIEVAWD